MPLGACDHCDQLYVIDSEGSEGSYCPSCRCPLRLATRDEDRRRLRQLLDHRGAAARLRRMRKAA
jgi:hypothetical protein